MNPPSSTTASTMASYDEQLKRAYSAASYDAMRAGAAQRGGSPGGMGGGTTATVWQTELKTTTDALNAALDELKTIREMMGSSGPGQAGVGGQVQPQARTQMQAGQQGQGILEQQQQAQAQQHVQTQTPGQLQIEQPSQAAGQMVPRRPTILANSATGSYTTLGTPYKQNQNIRPLRPPTSGTNIDIDRMVNPSVDARYLPTPSQARRIAKTEGNRMEATEAFGRGSAGYYGRRYGVWDSAYGYGPWAGAYGSSRYGTPYENSWQSYAGSYYPYSGPYYNGYGYSNPGYAYGPYSYGYGYGGGPWGYYDPFVYDYGWGNYYGDGRRNAYLWGSQRNGPDYYADTVEFAEGQREMDKERGRQEYARRRDWQERRMRGENMLPPGPEQQQQQMQMQMRQQGQQQQGQQQQGQATPATNGAGATNSYLNSMGAQNNAPQQPHQAPQAPQQAQQATAQANAAPKTPAKKFSYLESAERDAANSALATSQQANTNPNVNTDANGNVGTPDAPYAEAEQMPFRRGYDRYGTSYSDSRYNNPAYAPANGYWDPYFGYSNWGRYGYSYPDYGGYGGVRGGDWFSDQIRRSERERVYDAQARSRWTGYYGYYGGYGRNSWGDYIFTPASYI